MYWDGSVGVRTLSECVGIAATGGGKFTNEFTGEQFTTSLRPMTRQRWGVVVVLHDLHARHVPPSHRRSGVHVVARIRAFLDLDGNQLCSFRSSITATFSENVNAPPPLVVTNGSVVGDVEKESDSVFLYTIKPLLNGNITATIHADTCIDADGNGNKESNTLSFVSNYYSVDPPRVSLAFAGRTSTNAANPTLDISATFSEPVTGFDTSKILVTNGQARSLAGSGSDYLFTIQPTPPEGDVNVTVDAGAARDEIDRPNTASNSLTFAHDAVPPTCTIQMAGEVSSAVTVTAVFSEPVTGLEADKLLVVNATIAGFTAENASAYSFVLTPAEGDVSLQLPEGRAAVDGAGNPNSASNTLEFTYAVPPTVELVLSTPASYRQLAAVTATFSETVSGDMANALTVTGGAVEGVTSSDGRVHLYTIKPAINEAITAEVKANACTDVYGNPNVKVIGVYSDAFLHSGGDMALLATEIASSGTTATDYAIINQQNYLSIADPYLLTKGGSFKIRVCHADAADPLNASAKPTVGDWTIVMRFEMQRRKS
eukprot:jgi/Mesvir1/25726/Mv01910-RA.1